MSILIKGGLIVKDGDSEPMHGDILIKDEKIASISSSIEPQADYKVRFIIPPLFFLVVSLLSANIVNLGYRCNWNDCYARSNRSSCSFPLSPRFSLFLFLSFSKDFVNLGKHQIWSADDWRSGPVAAALGGTTSVIDFIEAKPEFDLLYLEFQFNNCFAC